MSEHARSDPPNHRPLTIDGTDRLEGLPFLRPPMEPDAPSIEGDRESPTTEFATATVKLQTRRQDHRLSLVQRLRQRRADYAMIGATFVLSVITGIAVATVLR